MNAAPLIFWFRQDLRLSDNPGLLAALAKGQPVIPIYIHDQSAGLRPWGSASRWWLHHTLQALDGALRQRGATLILRSGAAEDVLQQLIEETGATAVMWNRCYEPYAIARDTKIKARLQEQGVKVESHNSALLFEPWEIKTKSGTPFQVFTPFWKACRAAEAPDLPLPAPEKISPFAGLSSDKLENWQLLPTKPDWAGGLRKNWNPGETGAQQRLFAFLDGALNGYKEARNNPDGITTSRLSPHLHWGEISPRQIWHATQTAVAAGKVHNEEDSDHFLSEIGWREFSNHLLYHFPTLPQQPLNKKFATFPWDDNPAALQQWQRGMTGYPIVDAGLRELWQTGWMHNRVRMIVGSFLVKDLLIPWQQGEAWFWDTLVDANLANNTASWQWIAGCGADAAPYFRVFNPVLQGEKFDPQGRYIRQYVPELAELPDEYIHRPWEAPPNLLRQAGVSLGRDYPLPMVDHKVARDRALAAFAVLKESTSG